MSQKLAMPGKNDACQSIGQRIGNLLDGGGNSRGANSGSPPSWASSPIYVRWPNGISTSKSEHGAGSYEINESMRLEPGVRSLYAVSEMERPTHFTILEIYADRSAYEAHIKSAHFLKQKTGTKDMVKSLELIDTVPLVVDMKIK